MRRAAVAADGWGLSSRRRRAGRGRTRSARPCLRAGWSGLPSRPAAPRTSCQVFLGAGRYIGCAAAGQRDRVNDTLVQFLADAVGQRGPFEGEVVVDGVVGDYGGLVVADDR